MNINDFLQYLRNRFHREQKLPDEVVREFLRVLEEIRKKDVSCKEVFAQLDEYVEKEVRGEDVGRLMPLLREHLDLCSDCCDEYEALLDVLQGTAANP
jgi:uncharacterized protein Yka (UPF0111/DUF47 family)